MGFQLPKTILNIALQEKEYYKSINSMRKLVDKYEKAVNSLSEIEKNLFSDKIKELDDNLSPVLNSFNLNSLGIYDFITFYEEELKKFNEIRNKVEEKQKMIVDIVDKISHSKIITD